MFQTFGHGAPLIFDNKEWCNYAVVERIKGDFRCGILQFLTISADEVACVGRKDGTHIYIDREDTYRFNLQDWATFDKHPNEDNFDVGAFMVRTVGRDQVGCVRGMKTGEFYDLEPGKYVLYKKDFLPPTSKCWCLIF